MPRVWVPARLRELKLPLDITLNPAVTLITLVALWGLMIWMYVRPEYNIGELWWWKRRIELAFIWMYYAARNIWVVFLAWLYFSKFSKKKLAPFVEDKPEYSDASWALMMFSSGMGIALFYFGVSEPIYHLTQSVKAGNNRVGDINWNIASQEAILLTFFNFGIHGWVPFVLIAIALGVAHHHYGLPFSIRSIFYPLLGDRIYGWAGDFVDILAVIASFAGMAVGLGLATIQFSYGMNWESFTIPYLSTWSQNFQNYEVFTVVLIISSAVGLLSIILGLKKGAQTFSVLAGIFTCFVPLVIFFLDDSWYVLNLMTEMVGYYVFYFFKLGHHVDAFQKVDSGVDTKAHLSPWYDSWQGNGFYQVDKHTTGVISTEGDRWAVQDGGYGKEMMTGIYWGWWIALAPLVGMFMAKISKGRTIKSLIHWGVLVPTVFCFFWISIFGGLAVKMERRAIIDGCRCACTRINKGRHLFGAPAACGTILGNQAGQTALAMYYEGGPHGGEALATNRVTCAAVRPAVRGEDGGCSSIVQLSQLRPEERWFALLDEYMTGGWQNGAKNLGRFLGGVTCAALICWIITLLDVGSYVIDQILANGENRPHTVWRILMMFTAIALTVDLLRAGSRGPTFDSATALQILSFITGMLITLFLTALPVCIYSSVADDEADADHPTTETPHQQLAIYPACRQYCRTAGHPVTDVDEWSWEDIVQKNPINRWTQPVGSGALDIFDFLLTLDAATIPGVKETMRLLACAFAPWLLVTKAYTRIDTVSRLCESFSVAPFIFLSVLCGHLGWIALLIVEAAPFYYNGDKDTAAGNVDGSHDEGMWGIAWTCYIYMVVVIAGCRYSARQILKIKGNVVQDFFTTLIAYPMVVAQLDAQQLPIAKHFTKPVVAVPPVVQPMPTMMPMGGPSMGIHHSGMMVDPIMSGI
jgi:choline-glycine betaine transporter